MFQQVYAYIISHSNCSRMTKSPKINAAIVQITSAVGPTTCSMLLEISIFQHRNTQLINKEY